MSIEPTTKKRFASVDEASMALLDKKRHRTKTPHPTRRTTKKWPSIARSGLASQRSLRREARLECNFEKIGKGTDLHGPIVV